MLEQIAYKLPRTSEERQRVYVVGDLEDLSASALYSKVKKRDYTKGNEEEINFYNYLNSRNFGQTGIYFQEKEEKHKDFKKRVQDSDPDITISPPGGFSAGGISIPSSSCSGS
ncbi:MAG: hypothetical protein WDZ62_01455 [Candidatus Pacearchaeota archaeon]